MSRTMPRGLARSAGSGPGLPSGDGPGEGTRGGAGLRIGEDRLAPPRRGLRRFLPGAPVRGVKGGERPEAVDPVPAHGARTPLPFLEPERLPAAERAAVHMAAALLLAYPDDAEAERRACVAQCVGRLAPSAARADLEAFLTQTSGWTGEHLASHYVDTFDLRRRCALHLTYYSSGDTRRRGMALVTFVEAFRAAGFETESSELPDHLALVLELSAREASGGVGTAPREASGGVGKDGGIAAMLLGTHRQGIELVRSALHQAGSPYAHVLDAVCRTLPPVSPEAAGRLTELLSAGPPTELVGMAAPLLPFPTVRSTIDEGVRA